MSTATVVRDAPFPSSAPQSIEEIGPIEYALRDLDPLLRLRWNPEAYVVAPGRFDCYGKPVPPRREGRWEVIRLSADPPIVVYLVVWDGARHGDYRPIGWWLVEFMRQWDRANQHWMGEQQRLLEEEESERTWSDNMAMLELEESLHRHGMDKLKMKLYPGRGFAPTGA